MFSGDAVSASLLYQRLCWCCCSRLGGHVHLSNGSDSVFYLVFFSSFEAIHSLETIHALSLGSGEFRLLFYMDLLIQRTLQTAPFIFPYRN